MRVSCPHCKQRTRIRTSKRPVPVFYEAYVQCSNVECGWTGKVIVEFALTTSPSRMADPGVNIPIDKQSRELLLAQLATN